MPIRKSKRSGGVRKSSRQARAAGNSSTTQPTASSSEVLTGDVPGSSNTIYDPRTGKLMPDVEFIDDMGRKSARTVGNEELVVWPWLLPGQSHPETPCQQVMDNLVFHGLNNGLRRYIDGPRDAAPGPMSEMKLKTVKYTHEEAIIQVKDHDIFFIPGSMNMRRRSSNRT